MVTVVVMSPHMAHMRPVQAVMGGIAVMCPHSGPVMAVVVVMPVLGHCRGGNKDQHGNQCDDFPHTLIGLVNK